MSTLARLWDSDVAYSFRTSPVAIVAFVVAVLLIRPTGIVRGKVI